jgi:tetratricopeptide (TPR) repeat protein
MAAFALTAACATLTRPAPAPSIQIRLAEADALLAAGCYDCLVAALSRFEQLAGVDPRARSGVSHANGLMAIRERELGLIDSGRLQTARNSNPEPSDAVLFDVIDTLPRRLSGSSGAFDDSQLEAMMRARRHRAEWRPLLEERAGTSVIAAVTALEYECAFGDGSNTGVDAILQRSGDVARTPLVEFTAAICRGRNTERLSTLLTNDRRFKEIDYFLGQAAVARDLELAERHLQLAIEWRADWPAALFALAGVATAADDFDRAADFYARVLVILPANPDGLLGRVRSLSYSGHFDSALDAANQLLSSGRWYTGEGLYWKAWNEAQIGRNDAAWTDVHDAAKLVANAQVPKLTGILAIRRGELQAARAELQQAHSRNAADCEVDALLGGVQLELRDWAASMPPLSDAVACLDGRDDDLRKQIAQLRSAPGRERSITRREREIAGNQQLRVQSWFNLAVAAFNQGDAINAREYAGRVVDDDRFGARARNLLARIKP